MNRLAYVELEQFRSFRKKTRIEFPEKGLVRIKGKNLDTGGESGAGKSTVALAINYALGKCQYPATDLQSWGSVASPNVTLAFCDGARIERGKRFAVTAAEGDPVRGSAAQKEEWISRLFGGYDMEMVMALTYRGQKKPGLFLSKTDSQKKEFLTRLLGLDKFETTMEETTAKVKELRLIAMAAGAKCSAVEEAIEALGPAPDLDALVSEETGLRMEMVLLESAIVELQKFATDVKREAETKLRAEAEAFSPAVEAANKRVRDITAEQPAESGDVTDLNKWKSVVEECQQRLERLLGDDRRREDGIRQDQYELNMILQAANKAAGAAPGWLREKARLTGELERLKADVCPTCEREWDHAEQERDTLRKDLAAVEVKLDECAAAVTRADELQAQIAAIPRFQPDPKIARMQKIESDARVALGGAQKKLESERVLLDADRRQRLAEARAEAMVAAGNRDAAGARVAAEMHTKLQALQRQIDEKRDRWGETRLSLDRVHEQVWKARTAAEQRERFATQLAEAQVEMTAVMDKLHTEEDFLTLIGREGFLGSIFDEVLAEIGDETNQLLASVANTRHCTLRFDSESVTQKGTVRKEIKPVVTIHGYEASLEAGPSGGMGSVIELAVDLALGAVISRRTGMCPGWLILDECFGGLGAVEKESALEILQTYAADRLVLVVDHTTEFQGMFTRCIEVEYSGGDSSLAAA